MICKWEELVDLHYNIGAVGVVLLSALGGQYVLAKANPGQGQCPLFGVERCLLLGGSKCTIYMVRSIGGAGFVRCMEVVHFSEGPLLEVSLYMYRTLPLKRPLRISAHPPFLPKSLV